MFYWIQTGKTMHHFSVRTDKTMHFLRRVEEKEAKGRPSLSCSGATEKYGKKIPKGSHA